MSFHTLPVALAVDGGDCIGQFAYKPDVTSAVVFVHGLGGGTVTTWQDFNVLLPVDPRASEHDLFFFGYDSLNAPSENSAKVLFDFLERLTTGPGFSVLDKFRRPKYQQIVLVAHSLGAIVCRKALLMRATLPNADACEFKLILIAPADRANASHLWRLVDGPLKLLYAWALFNFPSLDDLTKESLEQLKIMVAEALKDHPFLIAALVLNAQFDKYVKPLPYCSDPHYPAKNAPLIHNTNHTSVCKPKQMDSAAYQSVASCL